MPTPDEQIATMLAAIEANNALVDHLDALKTGLEGRGWSTAASEQAAIVTTNTQLQLVIMTGHR